MSLSQTDHDKIQRLSSALARGINHTAESLNMTNSDAFQNEAALSSLEIAIESLITIFFAEITKQAGASIFIQSLAKNETGHDPLTFIQTLGELAIYSLQEQRSLNETTRTHLALHLHSENDTENASDQTLALVPESHALSYFTSLVLTLLSEGKQLQLSVYREAKKE